jgi:subtilisin family serine protease
MWHLTRINILDAWDIATGVGQVVAIIDAGVSTTHPDLAGNLLPGWCVVTETTTVDPVESQHGTACAGIVAAVANNSIGMAGVAPDAKILPVRCSVIESGAATEGRLAQGIVWAADHGADVCSLSFSLIGNSVIAAAAEYAATKNCVVVCAGPNTNASYTYDLATTRRMIATCGCNSSNVRQYAYGDWLDLCAPMATTATYSATGYAAFSGNSGTTPVVAGAVALIKQIRPELPLEDIRAILRLSANGSIISGDTPGWSAAYGAGLLDAHAALVLAQTWVPIAVRRPQAVITSPAPESLVG